jgi:hypothetical protein
MNQESIQHASVLNHIAAWKSGRLEASDITITHPGSPWKVFIWTFRDADPVVHLVIHLNGRVFERFEVIPGELGEVVESVDRHYRGGQPEQQTLVLATG